MTIVAGIYVLLVVGLIAATLFSGKLGIKSDIPAEIFCILLGVFLIRDAVIGFQTVAMDLHLGALLVGIIVVAIGALGLLSDLYTHFSGDD